MRLDSDGKSANRNFVGSWITLVLPVLFLSVLGLLVLMSAANNSADPYLYLKKQAIWMALAFAACVAAAYMDLNLIKKFALPIAIFSMLLLIAVLVPQIGKEVNGSRRWIAIGSVVFQPSDIAKFSLVILLSKYVHDNQRRIKTFWKGFVFPFGILGVFCVFIILEPDFGTTALCAAVGLSIIFLAGVRLLYLLPAFGGAAMLFGVMVYLNPNRIQRLVNFLDFEGNKADGTYQLYQAILAFGTGGVEGVGLGQGRQQLSYLPEAHTDFIFALIGEQLGLIYTLLVALSFLLIFGFAMYKLRNAPNLFEFSMGIGAMMMIVLQALFNMCVVTGLVPTKGISLPFISYGGSNLVVMFAFTGILINCIRTWSKPTQIQATLYE